jgi:hypothetical protein
MRNIKPRPLKLQFSFRKNIFLPKEWGLQPKYFSRGRDAVNHLINILKLSCDDKVILPALICNSIVEPFMNANIKVNFIDVGKDLKISMEDLEREFLRISPKIFLAVNYFGVGYDLMEYKKLCRKYNVIFIQDRCHEFLSLSFHSRDDIHGDYIFYSLRKFICIPDGGLLFEPTEKDIIIRKESKSIQTIKHLISWSLSKLLYSGLLDPYWVKNFFGKIKIYFFDTDLIKKNQLLFFPYSSFPSQYLSGWMNKKSIKQIEARRIYNFNLLSSLIKSKKILVCKSKLSSIPMGFPIYDLSEKKDLLYRLRRSEISAYKWPGNDIPKVVSDEESLYANVLANQLIILPIHQEIRSKEIKYIAKILNKETAQGFNL